MAEIKTKPLSIDDVRQILKNIRFAEYSCVDMDYQFEVAFDYINGQEYYFIRTSFMRKDINTGEFGKGWGRWHTTPVASTTETSIVMTAWVCIKMIVEHELLEGFEYFGKKVFNPHQTLETLIYPEKLPDER